ncbi:hypothetical protein G9A89_022050 [Geosiphon pyriformis]|nr:hypothetical protein G9A89_022050 [Geosiphon pyriformis]
MFATTMILDSKLSIKPRTISTELPIYDTTANLSTTSLSADNTSNLLTTVPAYLSAVVLSYLSTPTNSNAATKLISKQNPKAKTDTTELKIVNSNSSTDLQFLNPAIRIMTMEFGHWVHPKPECPTLFKSFGYPKRRLIQQLEIQPKQITYQQYTSSHHNQ